MKVERRIDVYDADELVAVFRPKSRPIYNGDGGEVVRWLVSCPRFSYNPWVGGTHHGPLRLDDWSWLLTTVYAALNGQGLRIEAHGVPPIQSEPGVVY